MKKTYLLTMVLLFATAWMAAQSTPQSTSPNQQTATPESATAPQTPDMPASIEGCLNGSAGSWTLTDQSGKTWQLAGDTSKLGDHVGHQVRLMGSEASKPPSGDAGSSTAPASDAGASSGSQTTFTVKKVRMISSSCPASK